MPAAEQGRNNRGVVCESVEKARYLSSKANYCVDEWKASLKLEPNEASEINATGHHRHYRRQYGAMARASSRALT